MIFLYTSYSKWIILLYNLYLGSQGAKGTHDFGISTTPEAKNDLLIPRNLNSFENQFVKYVFVDSNLNNDSYNNKSLLPNGIQGNTSSTKRKNKFRPISALTYAEKNLKPKINVHLKELYDKLSSSSINYCLNSTFYKTISIKEKSSLVVHLSCIEKEYIDYLIIQVHSQIYKIVLSYDKVPKTDKYANGTDCGLVIFLKKDNNLMNSDPFVYIHNHHPHDVSLLIIVRNYTYNEPIPGGLLNAHSSDPLPKPYLKLNQGLITTWVSFSLAGLYNLTNSYWGLKNTHSTLKFDPIPYVPPLNVKYEVFLTYMYEGDLYEKSYWKNVIATSTVKGVKANAKKVFETDNPSGISISKLFVSYSGVGAVVNVLATFNGSNGVLYTPSVFYGCDFIEDELYNCTKLASPFAKLLCAVLPFVAFILLVFGHRWLNFTMFIAGLLATWFILFVVFAQIPNNMINVLGGCTLIGALLGGAGWLIAWHKFRRPFFSALLIILLSSFFVAMISTHFLKYALVPTRSNLPAFVVFPVLFSVAVAAYSIRDIKKVHIFACTLLGSYGIVVPFAFYFGSSLTYIVINMISVMAIPGFSEAVGFPPFQYCDVAILCVWIALFICGTCYQYYRERSGPPFPPPNAAPLEGATSFFNFIKEKFTCLVPSRSEPQDDDSLFEARPSFWSRFVTWVKPSNGQREMSQYESFPRIGSDDEPFLTSFRDWSRSKWGRFKKTFSRHGSQSRLTVDAEDIPSISEDANSIQ